MSQIEQKKGDIVTCSVDILSENRLLLALSSMYVRFVENLRKCTKPFINLLFNSNKMDVSSQTGNNTRFLMDKYSKKTLQDLIRWKPMISKTRISPFLKMRIGKLE